LILDGDAGSGRAPEDLLTAHDLFLRYRGLVAVDGYQNNVRWRSLSSAIRGQTARRRLHGFRSTNLCEETQAAQGDGLAQVRSVLPRFGYRRKAGHPFSSL
jgi:hypothetical protein